MRRLPGKFLKSSYHRCSKLALLLIILIGSVVLPFIIKRTPPASGSFDPDVKLIDQEATELVFARWRIAVEEANDTSSSTVTERVVVIQPAVWPPRFTLIPWIKRCWPKSKSLDALEEILIIVVRSAINNSEHRDVIRKTWAAQAKELSIPVLFAIGQPNPEANPVGQSRFEGRPMDAISREHEFYGDILLAANFFDDYHALALKSLSILYWAAEICNADQYFITDDDCMVFPKRLVKLLRENGFYGSVIRDSHIFGRCRMNVTQISRSDKNMVPVSLWPEDTWPPFCHAGYTLSKRIASVLYEEAAKSKWNERSFSVFPDDALFTGVLRERAEAGISLVHTDRVLLHPGGIGDDTPVVIHGFKPKKMLREWPTRLRASGGIKLIKTDPRSKRKIK